MDLGEAMKWLHVAADKNSKDALIMLGKMYELGPPPIPKDLQQAAFYFRKAMELGSNKARQHLARVTGEKHP
jgi:TPR repeat protein